MAHLEELVDVADPDYTLPEDVEVMRLQSEVEQHERNVQTHLLLQEKFKPAQERRLTALDRVRRNDSAYAHLYRNRHSGQDRLGTP